MHPLLLQDFFLLRHLKLNKAKNRGFLEKAIEDLNINHPGKETVVKYSSFCELKVLSV